MKGIPVLCLSNKIRPAIELVEELSNDAEHFNQLALVMAQDGSKLVHFCWYELDHAALCTKIDKLIADGWIPLAVMGPAKSDAHLLARPLKEHQGRGIKKYLRKLMDKAARYYLDGM